MSRRGRRRRRRSRGARACRAPMKSTSSVSPARGEAAVDLGEPEPERQATESAKTSGAAPVPPSPPSMLTKSTPRPRPRAIAATRSSQNSRSPTADLMPTGSPVASATSSTKSSIESTSWKTRCRLGEAQSSPAGMPRISAISGADLRAPGSMPPSPGLAPWDSLISIARTGADATRSLSRARSKRPSRVAAAEVAVPIWKTRSPPLRWYGDSPPSPVFCRQPAIAAPRLSASIALPDSDAEAHPGDVDHRRRPERVAPARGPPEHLGRRERRVLVGVRGGRRAGTGEGAVLDDRVALGVLDVVVGAEPEVVVLELGRRVDPAPLVAAERPLLVVAGDDVLAQLGAEPLEQEAQVADDREVAQDRVLASGSGRGRRPRRARRRRRPPRRVHFMWSCLVPATSRESMSVLEPATVRPWISPHETLAGSRFRRYRMN